MGKLGRHKKRLKSEKSKTQLKHAKTKFLPKGLNVTKVDFKVRPIVLPEQLKAKGGGGEALSRRKLNVKELLTRLKHYNAAVRAESCGELVALISQAPDAVLGGHLCELLRAAGALSLDFEKKVRTEAVRLIGTILRHAPPQKIEPFFNVVLLHLQCGMTNIDPRLQDTSLSLLDCLLERAPVLIAKNHRNLLENFVSLVSVSRGGSDSSRALKIDLGNKLTSVKWRSKVMQRLYGIFRAIHAHKREFDERESRSSCLNLQAKHFGRASVALNAKNIYDLDTFGASEGDSGDLFYQSHIKTLLPLFYDILLEALPKKQSNEAREENTPLNEETASLLSCVVNVLYLSVKDCETDDLLGDANASRLMAFLMDDFPYSREKNAENGDARCLAVNLSLCYLFSRANRRLGSQNSAQKAAAVVAYLNKCLSNRNYVADEESARRLLAVCEAICLENAENWTKKRLPLRQLLINLTRYQKQARKFEEIAADLTCVLCRAGEKTFAQNADEYQSWLRNLPLALCEEEISPKMLDSLLLIAKSNNRQFAAGFLENLGAILEKLPKLKVRGGDDDAFRVKMAGLFYYLPLGAMSNLDAFSDFLASNGDSTLAGNLIDVLRLWFWTNSHPNFEKFTEKYDWLC